MMLTFCSSVVVGLTAFFAVRFWIKNLICQAIASAMLKCIFTLDKSNPLAFSICKPNGGHVRHFTYFVNFQIKYYKSKST